MSGRPWPENYALLPEYILNFHKRFPEGDPGGKPSNVKTFQRLNLLTCGQPAHEGQELLEWSMACTSRSMERVSSRNFSLIDALSVAIDRPGNPGAIGPQVNRPAEGGL
jgi:hypothetical protein